jgi:death on curing protein
MAPPLPLTACNWAIVESALAAPWEGFGPHERYPSLAEKAAVLAIRFVKGHACPDGNKRLGLILASAFLESFGAELDASAEETEHVFRHTAAAEHYDRALENLTYWFGQTIRPIEEDWLLWMSPG